MTSSYWKCLESVTWGVPPTVPKQAPGRTHQRAGSAKHSGTCEWLALAATLHPRTISDVIRSGRRSRKYWSTPWPELLSHPWLSTRAPTRPSVPCRTPRRAPLIRRRRRIEGRTRRSCSVMRSRWASASNAGGPVGHGTTTLGLVPVGVAPHQSPWSLGLCRGQWPTFYCVLLLPPDLLESFPALEEYWNHRVSFRDISEAWTFCCCCC